jgi:DNA-binding transcriptional LysR family regulator
MGLCYSPTWLFDEELQSGVMKVLLADWSMKPLPINAVYAPQRKNSAKVKAFIEHLSKNLGVNERNV